MINVKYFFKNLGWHFPWRTYWKARKIFKRPKIKCHFGNVKNGEVWGLVSSSSAYWNPILEFSSRDVTWKSKWNSPRFEYEPEIVMIFFKRWELWIHLVSPDTTSQHDYIYWETLLDYVNFKKPLGLAIEDNTWVSCGESSQLNAKTLNFLTDRGLKMLETTTNN